MTIEIEKGVEGVGRWMVQTASRHRAAASHDGRHGFIFPGLKNLRCCHRRRFSS